MNDMYMIIIFMYIIIIIIIIVIIVIVIAMITIIRKVSIFNQLAMEFAYCSKSTISYFMKPYLRLILHDACNVNVHIIYIANNS